MALLQDSGTGEVCLFNSASFGPRHAGGLTLGSSKRVRASFTGTGTNLVQAGSGTAVTGAAAGNTAGTGIYIGASNGSFAANTYLEVWLFDQAPTTQNLTDLDAWATSKYSTSFP